MGGSANADTSRHHRGVRPTFAGLTFDPISPEALGAHTRGANHSDPRVLHGRQQTFPAVCQTRRTRLEASWRAGGREPTGGAVEAAQPGKQVSISVRKLLDLLSAILGG